MKNFYGLTSLLLACLGIILGGYTLVLESVWLLLAYLILIDIGGILVIYFFCAKCPVKKNCAHVLPGKFAMLFKNREPGPYTRMEIRLMVIGMLLILGFPQYWLFQHTQLFFSFWILCGIALWLILANICNRCDNTFCPMNRRPK